MGFLRSVIALILNILFPTSFCYEPVTENEDSRMTTDGSCRAPTRSPHSSFPEPQARRRDGGSRRSGQNSNGENRRSFYQVVDRVQNYVRRRDAPHDDEETRAQGKSHRNFPSLSVHRVHQEETRGQPRATVQRPFQGECSESDIIRRCQSLNEKIVNTASSLVGEWALYRSIQRNFLLPSLSWSGSNGTENLEDVIGSALYNSIKSARSSSPYDEVQGLVTDALRTSAIYVATYIISARFCPNLSLERDEEMRRIFHNMLRGEPLSTALRWRALTYEFANTGMNSLANENLLASYFESIFIAAGEKNSSKFLARIPAAVKESGIIESVLELSELLKTKVFSTLLDVYTVTPGTPFHEMEMDVDSKKPNRNQRVLCTLKIGLKESIPQNGRARVVLKPQVALEER